MRRRRGTIYILVLGVSLIAVTLAVGGILAARVQARASDSSGDAGVARLCAQSGIELARLWISQNSNWRADRVNGTWASNVTIGSGTVSIDVADAVDTDLANRPHDAVLVTATGVKGQARCVLRQTLSASPVPLPALQYPLHTAGQLHVRANRRITVGNSTVSTNGSLRNDSVIEGNVEAGSSTATGIIYGTLTSGSAARAMPSSTIPEAYASLGTLIVTPSTIDKQVLTPTYNPWGTANAEGVYVIRSSSDITIKNTRVNGTLVIIAPGRKVTIDSVVFIQPARADYPSLIINGNAIFQYYSFAGGIYESSLATNLNPAGAPYNGVSDNDTSDWYPSEIQGLVHVTGTLNVKQSGLVRGAVVCESAAAADAVDIDAANLWISYDSSLYTNPPQFYTTSVRMIPLAGSMKQIVN